MNKISELHARVVLGVLGEIETITEFVLPRAYLVLLHYWVSETMLFQKIFNPIVA